MKKKAKDVSFLLTNTVSGEIGGAGIGQSLQQQHTHSVSDGDGQRLSRGAAGCPEQFEPNVHDRRLQRFVWVEQGRAQVLLQGPWWTDTTKEEHT